MTELARALPCGREYQVAARVWRVLTGPTKPVQNHIFHLDWTSKSATGSTGKYQSKTSEKPMGAQVEGGRTGRRWSHRVIRAFKSLDSVDFL